MRHYLRPLSSASGGRIDSGIGRTPRRGTVSEVGWICPSPPSWATARVIKQDVGVFDTMPLSLITTQTIASLGAWVEPTLTPERFRPNLLVEATGGEAFPEDEWVGSVLRIGDMRMRVDQRDVRCVMINIERAFTDESGPVVPGTALTRAGYDARRVRGHGDARQGHGRRSGRARSLTASGLRAAPRNDRRFAHVESRGAVPAGLAAPDGGELAPGR